MSLRHAAYLLLVRMNFFGTSGLLNLTSAQATATWLPLLDGLDIIGASIDALFTNKAIGGGISYNDINVLKRFIIILIMIDLVLVLVLELVFVSNALVSFHFLNWAIGVAVSLQLLRRLLP